MRASESTTVHLLGQADDIEVEERAAVEWRQEGDELRIIAARTQRLYNNRRWPNPVVLKITHAELSLIPPTVITGIAEPGANPALFQLNADLVDLGENQNVEVGFQYRLKKLLTDPQHSWQETDFEPSSSTGEYASSVGGLDEGARYEFRAAVRHRGIAIYGESLIFTTD